MYRVLTKTYFKLDDSSSRGHGNLTNGCLIHNGTCLTLTLTIIMMLTLLTLMVTVTSNPNTLSTGHFAYWSFRLRDISPTGPLASTPFKP